MPSRVDSLLAEMPAKESGILPRSTVDRLRQMEPDLPEGEEIRLIAYHGFPFGVAAITSSRLIIVLNDGGTKITPYSEVSSFALVEGKKKLLGGYSQTMLMTRFRNQNESHTGYLGHDGQWGIRAGRELLAAQERYSVRNI
jgi:hypothetical protein